MSAAVVLSSSVESQSLQAGMQEDEPSANSNGVDEHHGVDRHRGATAGEVESVLSSSSGLALQRAVAQDGFEKLWTELSGAPWAEPYIAHLLSLGNQRLTGGGPSLNAQNLLADVHGAESLHPLGAGTVVIMDLNGYSNFQNNVSQTLRQKLDKHMQEVLFPLGKELGISMLQMPAGDMYAFFLEKSENASLDGQRLAAFLERVRRVKISTGIAASEMHRYGLNATLYPEGFFTFSTGVKAVQAGEVQIGVFTGSEASDQGFTAVFGRGYVEALKLQKKAGKGEMLLDKESQLAFESGRGTFENVSMAGGRQPSRLQEDEVLTSAVSLAVLHALHARGSLSSSKEASQADLGVTAIGIRMGGLDMADLADSPMKYVHAAQDILILLGQSRFRDFYILKQDGETLHILCRKSPKNLEDKELIEAFCRKVGTAVQAAGLSVQVGVDYAKAMLDTPYRGCLVRDRASQAIVHEARLSHAPGFSDGDILFGGDYLTEAGNRLERSTFLAKGGPIQYLKTFVREEGAGRGPLEAQELIGREELCKQLSIFLSGAGETGNVLHIQAHGKGYGRSALLRYARNLSLGQGYEFTPLGGGELPHIRDFLAQFLLLPIEGNSSDETVNAAFLNFLKEPESYISDKVLLLDSDNLSTREQDCFSRLAQVLPGTSLRFIHTGQISDGKSLELKALTSLEAAKLILQVNRQYADLDESIIAAALTQALEGQEVTSQASVLPLTPRNAIHIFAPALEVFSGQIKFEVGKMHQTSTGELGARLRADRVAPFARKILGVLARIRTPVSADQLWLIYCSSIGEKAVEKRDFEEALEALAHYLVCSEETLSLRSQDSESAKELFVPSSEEDFSNFVLEHVYSSNTTELPNEISEKELHYCEAELDHLFSLPFPTSPYGARTSRLVEKLGLYYLDQKMNEAARRLYYKYTSDWLAGAISPHSSVPLYMDMAWTFQDTRDPQFLNLAQEIYEQLRGLPLTEEQKFAVKWREFRLIEGRPDSNGGAASHFSELIDSQSKKDAQDRMLHAARIYGLHEGFIAELKNGSSESSELHGRPEARMLLWTLQFSEFFYKISVLLELPSVLEDRRDQLTAEYRAFMEAKKQIPPSSFDFVLEMQARALYMEGPVVRHLFNDISKEVLLQEEAASVLSGMQRIDSKIQRRYRALAVQTRNLLIRDLIMGPLKNGTVTRDLVEERLTALASQVEKLSMECALTGDRTNRCRALVQGMNVLELRIAAIGTAPREGENNETISSFIKSYMHLARISAALDNPQGLVRFIDNLSPVIKALPSPPFSQEPLLALLAA